MRTVYSRRGTLILKMTDKTQKHSVSDQVLSLPTQEFFDSPVKQGKGWDKIDNL